MPGDRVVMVGASALTDGAKVRIMGDDEDAAGASEVTAAPGAN
jgi:hypothetical protein